MLEMGGRGYIIVQEMRAQYNDGMSGKLRGNPIQTDDSSMPRA